MKITRACRWPRLSDWRWPRLRPCVQPRIVLRLTSVAAAARPTGPSSRVRIYAPCWMPGRPNKPSRPPTRNCAFRASISWMRDPAPSLCAGCANPVAARCKWPNAWLSTRRWTKSPPCSARAGSGKCRSADRVGVSGFVGGKRKAGRGPPIAPSPPGFCRACRCANRHLTAVARLVTPARWVANLLTTGTATGRRCCHRHRRLQQSWNCRNRAGLYR
jgi:hypothetical protein